MRSILKRSLAFLLSLFLMAGLLTVGLPTPAAYADSNGAFMLTVTRVDDRTEEEIAADPDVHNYVYHWTVGTEDKSSAGPDINYAGVTIRNIANYFSGEATSAEVNFPGVSSPSSVEVTLCYGQTTEYSFSRPTMPDGFSYYDSPTWAVSSGTDLVNVDSSGKVTLIGGAATGTASGMATVTMTLGGIVQSYTVNVQQPVVSNVSIAVASATNGAINADTLSSAGNVVATVTVTGTNLSAGLVTVTPSASGLSAGSVTVNEAKTSATCDVSFSGSDDAETDFSITVNAHGTEQSASFKIDNVAPTGSFAVSFDDSGDATVDTSGINDCDSAFTAGTDTANLTNYAYNVSSFTESTSGSDTLYLRAWDLHQNAMYVSVPIEACTISDPTTPGGTAGDDGNVYYNSSNMGDMAIPVSFDGPAPSLGDDFAVSGTKPDYVLSWPTGAASGSIGPDFSGSVSYSGYGYSATAPITNSLSRSYVLDTTAPTVTAIARAGKFFTNTSGDVFLGVPSPKIQGQEEIRGTDTVDLTTADNEGGSGLAQDLASKTISVLVKVINDLAQTQTISPSDYVVKDKANNANEGIILKNEDTDTGITVTDKNIVATPIVPAYPESVSITAPDAVDGWYSSNMTASLTIHKGKDYSDNSLIEPSAVAATFNGSAVTCTAASGSQDLTLDVTGIEAENVELNITVTSNSPNVKEAMITTAVMKYNVDALAPRVTSASIDGTRIGEKYFDASRKLTVTVEDLHSFSGTVSYTFNGEARTATFSTSPFELSFSDDGAYVITGLTVTDAYGNTTDFNVTTITGDAATNFIVDTTKPVIAVSYDNNDVRNELYFKADRTATVTVTEVNFDASLVNFGATTGTVGTWTDSGNTHTVTVVFDTEAEHSFAVSMKDLANNPNDGVSFGTSDVATASFIIDKTAPTVTLALDHNEDVRNSKYFSIDKRTLTITAADTNMGKTEGGEVSFLSGSATFGTDGLSYDFTGDGTYGVRTVTVTDLAGNVSSITFTANDVEPDLVGNATASLSDAIAAYEFVLDTTAPTMTVRLTSETDGSDSSLEGITIFQKVDETDEPGKYYLIFTEDTDAVSDENQLTLDVTLDLEISDLNLLTPGGDTDASFVPATVNAFFLKNTAGTEEYAYVTEALALATAADPASGTISYTATLTVEPNEACYIVYTVAVADLAGNLITESDVTEETNSAYTFDAEVDAAGTVTNTFSFDRRQASTGLDTGVPTIEFDRDKTPVVDHLYSEDVTYTVNIADGEEESEYDDGNTYHNYQHVGLKSVTYEVTNGTGEGELTIAKADNYRTASGTIKVSPDNDEANDIEVKITAIDKAGNKIMRKDTIDIDKLAPRVTYSITGASARSNEYYNAARTATITVEDANFSSGYVTVNGKATALKVGENYVAFNGPDTDYTVAIHTEDKVAANTADSALKTAHTTDTNNVTTQGENPWKFTVDTVAPVLTVVFDNNNSRNGNYYKDKRTAMATITERNFDENDVVFNNQGAGCALTGWTAADPHTSIVPCTKDGTYHFTIAFQDLAGNQATQYDSNVFIIDLTEPTVEISNIEPYSANRGAVAPRVTFQDTNFDPNGYKVVTMKVFNLTEKGEVTLSTSTVSIADGVQIDFSDLASTIENDGIYTITATITDMAGNSSEQSVTYSVNRKGSTYYAKDDATKDLLSGVYSNSAPTIRIAEVNPDTLDSYSVTVSVNNKSSKLTEGSDFSVAYSGGKDTFNEYVYTINSSVFQQDGGLIEGAYTIVFDSTDRAGNINSNRDNERNAPVNFTLDSTPPILSITGVADRARIKEASREVTVIFQDATSVTKIEVYLNGQLIKTLEGDQITGDSFSFPIDQSNSDQDLEIRATDAAGNVATSTVSKFYINSSGLRQFVHNTPVFVGSLAGVGVAAGLAIYFATRKKKNTAGAEAEAK